MVFMGLNADIHNFPRALSLLVLGAATMLVASVSPSCGPQPLAAATGAEGAASAPQSRPALPETISFNEHIQPILSESCYHCHGPDSSSRAPRTEPLRIDRAEFAFLPRADSGQPVIIPGDPDGSALWQRIASEDPALMMPPPGPHHHLDARQLALIRAWIERGAEYQEHWAFLPPVESVPPVPDPALGVVKNPIDAFVLAELPVQQLRQKPEEEPRRLGRRIFLDMIGLPPTPEEVDAFVAAHAADPDAAVDRLLDDLFARPAYGEQQGRHWLDVARYADTHGIHIDNYRAIWPYRDWVVAAFNANQRWDRFTVEQIAGDLLPNPTLEQRIATGFQRCLPTTGEGGAIPEEYEAIYAQDRVDTVAAGWLGLTTGCAACHDHKFDPLSTRENYQLTAFFRNTTMAAMDQNAADHPPNLFAPLQADRARWPELEGEIAAFQTQIERDSRAAFEQWLARHPQPPELPPADLLCLPLGGYAGRIQGTAAAPSTTPLPSAAAQPLDLPCPLPAVPGLAGSAIQLDGSGFALGDFGEIEQIDGHSVSFFIKFSGAPNGAVLARMERGRDYRGWDIWLENGRIGAHLIERWPDLAVKGVSKNPLAPDQWHHVLVVFHPDNEGQRLSVFVDGVDAEPQMFANAPLRDIRTGPDTPLRLGARSFGADLDSRLSAPVAIQDLRLYARRFGGSEVPGLVRATRLALLLRGPVDQRSAEGTEELFAAYLRDHPGPAEPAVRLAALAAEREAIRQRGSLTLVMEERADSAPVAHILERGSYASPGEEVHPAVPAVLPPLPAGAPANRLGLARWLVDPVNPLPARVTMNRLWSQLFGRGLVASVGDFGIMGERPTHPELLDWLALRFIASGWDYQAMLRLMIGSATYRQAAVAAPAEIERDPDNRWLARGPRLRLDGEEIRDLALAGSGLLVDHLGGPPVKPYQPDGVWEAVAMKESDTKNYARDHGEALWRRSLYSLWKRTAPPASLAIFDAPSREVTCPRRETTNTPLQAFVLMNDPQFLEASRQLAARTLTAAADFDARLDFLTRHLLGREFATEERAVARRSLDQFRTRYDADPAAAAAVLAIGEAPQPHAVAHLPVAEQAAWTMLANLVLNLDETITK